MSNDEMFPGNAPEQPRPQKGMRIIGDPAPLFAALAAAQAAFEPIIKNRTVTVRPKKREDGWQPPEYKFDYATLDEVQSKTLPALNANGLSMLQPFFDADGVRVLRTILAHASGSRLEVDVLLPQARDVQEAGKALTFIKRYQWGAMIGVSPEEDDDGNAADGNEAKTAPRDRGKPAAPPAKAAPPPKAEPKPEPKPAPASEPTKEEPAPSEPTPTDPEPQSEVMLTAATQKRLGTAFRKLEYGGDASRQFIGEVIGREFPKGASLSEQDGLKVIAALNAEGSAMQADWSEV